MRKYSLNSGFRYLFLLFFLQTGIIIGADLRAVPTFHCMSLYWSPENEHKENDVLVFYKESSSSVWRSALSMRYNPIENSAEDRATHRGSVVNLKPGTSYDFKLRLKDTNDSVMITQATWSEIFPEGEIVNPPAGNEEIVIESGGREDSYKVYDGMGVTIDVRHEYDACINIKASYLIVRRFILKGAGKKGPGSWPPAGGIKIADGVHDVVIEDCDISDFGRVDKDPYFPTQGYDRDSGILFHPAPKTSIRRIIIQRNKIHHPAYDSSNWFEPQWPTHSEGPQGITTWDSDGNHVFRYNEFYSDMEHMFNDIISGTSNGSYRGAPGPDSDIYCNYLSNSWDDALEIEGGGQNIRCWNNYITQSMMMIGNAVVSIGPLYIWKNVVNKSEWQPDGARGSFIKMGYSGGEELMTGHMYIFNNTILQENNHGCATGLGGTTEPGSLYKDGRLIKHCVSRNNIFEIDNPQVVSISCNPNNTDNDYDYDLYDGRVPEGSEAHGIYGDPIYAADAGFDSVYKRGNFQLAPESPGYDDGVIINNFSDGYNGNAPDMGAHESGTPDFQYGVNASFLPQDTTGTAVNEKNGCGLPDKFILYDNYPNPFNPKTTIRFYLPRSGHVNLKVYNILGQEAVCLLDRDFGRGVYSTVFDASALASGVYIYRIIFRNSRQARGNTIIKKMILLK